MYSLVCVRKETSLCPKITAEELLFNFIPESNKDFPDVRIKEGKKEN